LAISLLRPFNKRFFSANHGSGLINAKYGSDPGLKIYSFLSGQYGSFHSGVIGATSGEAPFVLDGLLSNPASFDPLVHYTDRGVELTRINYDGLCGCPIDG
jgi:TnpA family transposase